MRLIRLSNRTGAILVALGLSLSVLVQQSTISVSATNPQTDNKGDRSPQASTRILSVTATAGEDGVLIEWRTAYEMNNVGFNLYREQAGRRTLVNPSIIPGSALIVGEGIPLRGGYSYSAFDRAGTLDTRYYLESIDLRGTVAAHGAVAPRVRMAGLKQQSPDLLGDSASSAGVSGTESSAQRSWPASTTEDVTAEGSIEDQWAIAAQPGLKIGVRQDGWYRLTQAQLAAAGLDPATDAGNLRMFVGAREVAIRVSRNSGPLAPADFIEFFGSGLDIPSTDTQIYWLTGGTQAGRRIPILGEVSHDNAPRGPAPPSAPSIPSAKPNAGPGFISFPSEWFQPGPEAIRSPAPARNEQQAATDSNQTEAQNLRVDPDDSPAPNEKRTASPLVEKEPGARNNGNANTGATATRSFTARAATVQAAKKRSASRVWKNEKRKLKKRRSSPRRGPRRNHASGTAAAAAPSFLQAVERQDRGTYYSSLRNGEPENFFGQVFSTAVTQTLTLKNIETTAEGPAQLQVALQGVSAQPHQVNVFFNDVLLGPINFFFHDHPVVTFPIPVGSLIEGSNAIKLVSAINGDTNIVDYVRVTYPHSYRAENNALRFSARFTQTVKVDGFTSANVRVLDITDPSSVEEVRPILETSASGYAITVPATGARAKGRRALLAFADDQFQQPASVSLNQPSSLNSNSSGADLVIIAHANFLPSVASLASQRQAQGLAVTTVNVEDIYDEFSYGIHSPFALKDFLSRAANSWTKAPGYLMLLGDASYDPRNYQAVGDVDFVPTKLVDTFYMETASDDWLADFDNDGVPEMAVGRLPARTVAEANIMISRIVNFLPANVPQSALLVADAQGSYYFNFEQANSEIAAMLPASMTVQNVNRRTEPSDAATKANIISRFNAGQALVNYSGHGNVDAWAGSIFTSTDAKALTNGNKVPFAVVMDCLNGYFVEPRPLGEGLAESLLKAPNGGAVAAFASSGLTLPDGQHEMSNQLYQLVFSGPAMPLGDAVRQAKNATFDIDVRRTWIFFGDPSMKIR